jgi:hypothetical protein
MQVSQALLHGAVLTDFGLQDGERFAAGFDLTFPPVDGLDTGHEIATRDEALFHKGPHNSARGLLVGKSREDDYGFLDHQALIGTSAAWRQIHPPPRTSSSR